MKKNKIKKTLLILLAGQASILLPVISLTSCSNSNAIITGISTEKIVFRSDFDGKRGDSWKTKLVANFLNEEDAKKCKWKVNIKNEKQIKESVSIYFEYSIDKNVVSFTLLKHLDQEPQAGYEVVPKYIDVVFTAIGKTNVSQHIYIVNDYLVNNGEYMEASKIDNTKSNISLIQPNKFYLDYDLWYRDLPTSYDVSFGVTADSEGVSPICYTYYGIEVGGLPHLYSLPVDTTYLEFNLGQDEYGNNMTQLLLSPLPISYPFIEYNIGSDKDATITREDRNNNIFSITFQRNDPMPILTKYLYFSVATSFSFYDPDPKNNPVPFLQKYPDELIKGYSLIIDNISVQII